jgi:CMP/dCMP kinase
MSEPAISLITLSREFGAGGSEFALALGVRLGWTVLDRDIVHRVASRLRMQDETVEPFDEHPPSLLARIATVLIIPQPDMYSVPSAHDVPTHDMIAGATRAVIEQAGESPPLIVVGHGAQCIFSGRMDVLHVRLIAPIKSRIARIVERMHVDPAVAGTLLRRADQDRQAYVQRFFHTNWRNDLLYDMQFNTGRISIDQCVQIVAGIVEHYAAGSSRNAGDTPNR